MSLNQRYLATYPFLHKDDVLWLSPQIQLTKKHLHDAPLGAKHLFAPSASGVFEALAKGTNVVHLQTIAQKSCIESSQLVECLGFLNSIGVLQRRITYRTRISRTLALLRDRLLGIWYPPFMQRAGPARLDLLLSIFSVTLPVMVSSFLLAIAIYTAGLQPGKPTLVAWGATTGVFIASLYAHELSHLWLLKHWQVPNVMLVGFLRLGIAHKKLQPWQELCTAIAGPLTGAAIGGIALAISIVCGNGFTATSSGVVCLIHLLGLLPWYGDGKSIKEARRLL